MRAVIYARYSSDNQRDASIEDQVRLCKERIEREGWTLVQVYRDKAMSGASALRPGYQGLLEDARRAEFDFVVTEALDRLSRDQEDVAGLYKRFKFAGVDIVTLAEGQVTELHIGLKGTMNALFLKDLADKTRRGQRGRVEQGKSAGGLCYGYDVVRGFDGSGQPVRGGLVVNESQAATVRRVFKLFASGVSPIAIAKRLNSEGVAGPSGRAWRDTTIRGHAQRGTGLLRNDLYVGRRVWNRMHFMKDPATGKRVSRQNPPGAWIVKGVPELRIIDQDLWARVQDRLAVAQATIGERQNKLTSFWEARRSSALLSGKISCGCCGGAMTNVGRDYLACTTARRQGMCANTRGIRRSHLETLVLDALGSEMMASEHVAVYVAEFTAEWNRLQATRGMQQAGWAAEHRKTTTQIARLIDAVADGSLTAAAVRDRLVALEQTQAGLAGKIGHAPQERPCLHPNLAALYRERVASLREHLAGADASEVVEHARALIERIVLTPRTEGGFEVEILGHLAAMVRLGQNVKSSPGGAFDVVLERSMKVVAGTGFEPVTFRL